MSAPIFDGAACLIPLTPTYVLVDPMLGEPLPEIQITPGTEFKAMQAQREAAWQRPVELVQLHPSIELLAHQYPYLVSMEDEQDPLLGMTLDMAQDERLESQAEGLTGSGQSIHRIGGWLQSTLAPHELSRCMAGLMHVNSEASTRARYLRLGDRRVLAWLRTALGNQRVSDALGRISRWLYVDPFGQLDAIDTSREVPLPLRFTVPEWLDFMDGHALHQIVARCLGQIDDAGHYLSLPSSHDIYLRAKLSRRQAQQAAQHWPDRFRTARDFSAWAVLDLMHPGREIKLPVKAEPSDTIDLLSSLILATLQEQSIP